MQDLDVDNLLADSGLVRKGVFKKSPFGTLQDSLQKALEGQDQCMLNIGVYRGGGGHALGVYQEKAGDPILFYDPNFDIQTVNNIEELVKAVKKSAAAVSCQDFYRIIRIIDVEGAGGEVKLYEYNKSRNYYYRNWNNDSNSRNDKNHPFYTLRSILKSIPLGEYMYISPSNFTGLGSGFIWGNLGKGEYMLQYEGLGGEQKRFLRHDEDSENKMFVDIINYIMSALNNCSWNQISVFPANANPFLKYSFIKKNPKNLSKEAPGEDKASGGLVDMLTKALSSITNLNLDSYSDTALRGILVVLQNFVSLASWAYKNSDISGVLDSVLPDSLIRKLKDSLKQNSSNEKNKKLLDILSQIPVENR